MPDVDINTMTLDASGDNELSNLVITRKPGDKLTFEELKTTIISNDEGVLQLKVNEVTLKDKPPEEVQEEEDDSPAGVILLTKEEGQENA